MVSKTVLITGTSGGGIGAALALAFHEKGYYVFLTARSISKIPSSLSSLPNTTVVPLDVTSEASIKAAVTSVREQKAGHGLDVLVNNSGSGLVMPLVDTDINKARALFEVNVWGTFAVTQAFIPLLVEAKGTVVSTSSLLGEAYMPFRGIYAASKAATQQMGETLRLELAPFGVRSVTTVTGLVGTNFDNNVPEVDLPSSSMYMPLKKEIEDRAKGVGDPTRMPVDVYARRVVADIAGGKNGLVRRGNLATILPTLLAWLPRRLTDYFWMQSVGLLKLTRLVKAQKA